MIEANMVEALLNRKEDSSDLVTSADNVESFFESGSYS